jgi:hypothetical protein
MAIARASGSDGMGDPSSLITTLDPARRPRACKAVRAIPQPQVPPSSSFDHHGVCARPRRSLTVSARGLPPEPAALDFCPAGCTSSQPWSGRGNTEDQEVK